MSTTIRVLSRLFPRVARLVEERDGLRAKLDLAKGERDREKGRRKTLRAELEAVRDWVPVDARPAGPAFRLDGMATSHTPGFWGVEEFEAAYAAGVSAAGEDYRWPWRVHVALWAAAAVVEEAVPGDFVEFGAGKGFLSAAIQHRLDWENQGRVFWMFDTYSGLVESQISEEEYAAGRRGGKDGRFKECFKRVEAEFGGRRGVNLVRGPVPDTLGKLEAERVAFCSMDMNCAEPEIAAAEHVWPLLSRGATVVLDDYGYDGYEPQRVAWNAFARDRGFEILCLPTGQGLWRKA